MNAGRIQRAVRERLVPRHDAVLPTVWVHAGCAAASAPTGSWLTRADGRPATGARQDAAVLVMLSAAAAPNVADLLAHGQAGARVYVLAPAGWSTTDPALLRCPKVLIRRLLEVPVTGVHTADGAFVWLGATSGGRAPWRLRLDSEQAAAFRQVFTRLFWHQAGDEGWTGGPQVCFRTAAARPFDVPELPANAAVRLMGADATIAAVDGGHLLVHGGTPPTANLCRLWIPPSGTAHASLARLVAAGTEVVWDDRDLPEVATDGHCGFILLQGTRGRLGIALTPPQAAEAAALLETPTAWRFRRDLRLGDGSNGAALWLDNAPKARPVEREEVIEVADVQAPALRDVDTATPDHWPEPQPLALTAHYRWTVVPPRVPGAAQEDTLISRWQQVDADWSSRLAKVREALVAAEHHGGRIGQKFSRLLSAMMGYKRIQGELLAEVTSLEGERPSDAGPASAPSLLQRLADLEAKTSQLHNDLEVAEREAHDEEEKARQQAAWNKRIETARRDLQDKRSELAAAQKQQQAVSDELAQVRGALKSADKKSRKDFRARQHKLSDDLQQLERRVQRLPDEIAALEQQTDEPFTFTPAPPARRRKKSKKSKGRFVPSSAQRPACTVPEEALPQVGALRCHNGQRYLVIHNWEELATGERDARRLGAQLVTREDP